MATRQQALTQYNEQHGTTHTLTTLATALLNEALRDAWLHYRRTQVILVVEQETVEAT